MAVNNSLAKQAQKPSFSVFLTQDAIKKKMNEIIGGKDGQRFMTQVLSAVTNSPDLQRCEHMTILNCAFLGESLKLSPSPQLGHYYMVPFEDNKNNRTVATFVLGYKGYIQLATRSGYYKKLNVIAIKEGELVNFDPLNETIDCMIIADEKARENAPTIGYYAMFEYANGFRKAIYWSKTKMEAHAQKYSNAYRSDKKKGTAFSYWAKDFDGMGYKTMLRQLISKWGIMSIEMQEAIENDMSFVDEKGTSNYVDNNDLSDTQVNVAYEVETHEEIHEDNVPDFMKDDQAN